MLDKIDKVVESTGIKLDVDNEYIKKYVKPDCTGELRDESDAKTVSEPTVSQTPKNLTFLDEWQK
jgi:hypothetical protein